MSTFWLNGEGPQHTLSPTQIRKTSDCSEKSLRLRKETAELKQPVVEATFLTSIPVQVQQKEISSVSDAGELYGPPAMLQQLQYPGGATESFQV